MYGRWGCWLSRSAHLFTESILPILPSCVRCSADHGSRSVGWRTLMRIRVVLRFLETSSQRVADHSQSHAGSGVSRMLHPDEVCSAKIPGPRPQDSAETCCVSSTSQRPFASGLGGCGGEDGGKGGFVGGGKDSRCATHGGMGCETTVAGATTGTSSRRGGKCDDVAWEAGASDGGPGPSTHSSSRCRCGDSRLCQAWRQGLLHPNSTLYQSCAHQHR